MSGRVFNKRLPEMDQGLYGRYSRMSQAEWAEVYFDVLHQCFGESMSDEEIMQDAEKRLSILKRYRRE